MTFVDDRGRLEGLSAAKRELLQTRLRGQAGRFREVLRRDPSRSSAPMSPAQHGMWVANEFLDNNALYSVYRVLRVTGRLDPAVVRRCLDAIVERHEVLRTTYSGDTPPHQVIHPPRPAELRFVDLSTASPQQRWADALELARKEIRTPFDLANGPVFRTLMVATGTEREPEHLLLFNLHHIVADDWACTVLLREFGRLYGALAAGDVPSLPSLPVQYADFAQWQHDRVSGELKDSQLSHWRAALADIPQVLDLPTDHPRPAVPSHRGGKARHTLAPVLSAGVRTLAASRGVTVYTVLLTAFAEVLRQLAGQDRFAVGSLLSGRNATETEPLIGLFANTVAIPVDLTGPRDFGTALRRTHEAVLGAFEHQDVTFENVVAALHGSREAARNPIYQVLYQCFEAADDEWDIPFLRARPVELFDGMSKVDMMFTAVNGLETIELELNYALDLFTDATARRLLEVHLVTLLEQVTARPDEPVTALGVLGPDLHRLVTETWSTSAGQYPGAAAYPVGETVVDLFRARAVATPRAEAVRCDNVVLTYDELDSLSDLVASGLAAEAVEPGAVVGIALPRSVELVIAVMGVLKAGAAYLPLDPGYPRSRLEFVLTDAAAQLVITEGSDPAGGDLGDRCRTIRFDELTRSGAAVPDPPAPTDLAYVLYTSGSTGTPKGAEITHRSLTNLLFGVRDLIGASQSDRWLFLTSLAFDISTVELFLPLVVGGTAVVVPESARTDGAQQCRIIRDNEVTHVQATPSGWRLLLEAGFNEPAVVAVTAGEALPVPLAHDLCARTRRLINGYGPTEATVYATFADVPSDVDSVTIGRPAANTRIYLLNDRMEPVPPGSLGEIYIGGAGVARGYRGRRGLTSRRFLPDPFGPPGARLYRTGDRARFTATGEIELQGRIDNQVKIRGHRVEPGEVEHHLVAHPDVDEALVMAADGPSGPRLIAYVASEVDDVDLAARLRRHLADRLPGYLVPSAVVRLERLPLTPNGKVDRGALPPAEPGAVARSLRAPATEAERALGRIWNEVLGLGSIGADDNFFELGGDSVLAVHIVSRAREAGLRITPRQVLTQQTLGELAAGAEQTSDGVPQASAEQEETSGPGGGGLDLAHLALDSAEVEAVHRLTPLQAGMLYHTLRDPLEYVRQFTIRIDGSFNEVAFATAWQRVVSRHAALRSRFLWEETAEPVQVVEREVRPLEFERHDWRDLDARTRGERMRALRVSERERGFDLAAAPPVRFALVRDDETQHSLVWTMHHLVFDAWSVNIVLAELFATYEPLCRGGWPEELPACVQFGGYVEQALALSSGDDHWKALLDSFDTPTELGIAVPAGRAEGIGHHRVVLPTELIDRMRAVARQNRVTVGTVLHAAWALVLGRYSGRADVLFGTTVSGRSSGLPGVEQVVGLLMNTLPVRVAVPSSAEVGEWLCHMHAQLVTMRELEHCSLVEVQRHSGVPAGQRLFDTILDYTNDAHGAAGLPAGVSVEGNVESSGTGYPLVLAVTQGDDDLVVELEHQLRYCDPEAARRMLTHFETALRGLCDSSARLGEVGVLPPEELALVTAGFNATGASYPVEATVHGLFEEQARRNPAAVAVRNVDGSTVSYGELNAAANQLAHHLGSLGVGAGHFVGVCVDHSVDLFAALLGILKTGAAYVPLDPEQPADRLGFILSDTAAGVVVATERTGESLPASFEGLRVLLDAERDRIASCLASDPAPAVDSSALLYVMYTSGSTGRPKGVLVPHRGVVNYLWWAIDGYGVEGERGAPMLGSVAFDLSVPNFFLPLIAGKDVTLLPPDRSLDSLARLLEEPGDFSLLKITPGHLDVLRSMVSAGAVDSVRTFVVGADEVRTETVAAWRRAAPTARIINEYGPTETVVGCSVYLVPEDFDPSVPVSIGKPIANMEMYVLDDDLRPVPIGVAGELYIGGDGVAHGYLGRPGLTAQRFLPDPYRLVPGARLYRTGDMARFRVDGNLEFLGRNDHQVKIRGYRIELGEVEARLLSHPAVSEAVAVAWNDAEGYKRLVAYVVSDGESPPTAELRRHVREALPDYMVPSIFVWLDTMPLSQGGKVDRSALPAPGSAPTASPDEVHKSSWTSAQRTLARIWGQVLGTDQIGLHDNFFALGGDSILSIQVLAAARREGLWITPRQMFVHQTIAELAADAEESQPRDSAPAQAGPISGDAPLTPIQRWFTQLDWPYDHYNQSVRLRWSGAVDEHALSTALGHLVTHHDAMRLRLRRNDDGSWRQVVVPEEKAEILRVVDLTGTAREELADAVRSAADEVHAGLGLADGPVVLAALLRGASDTGDEVVISVHHVAVDTVSWTILLEDLASAYRAALAGESPVLPAKTTSVLEWAERLAAHAHSPEFRDESAHWRALRPVNTPLPVDNAEGDSTAGTAEVVTTELDRTSTEALLRQAPGAYRTRVQELLVTALGQVLVGWAGGPVVVDVEGHGREPLFDDVDLTRTIGWFTTLRPLQLDLLDVADHHACIRRVKEAFRAVQHNGIGYGIAHLPYGHTGGTTAQISFNYHGQAGGDPTGPEQVFSRQEPVGVERSPHGVRPYLIEVIASVADGRLRVDWEFSPHVLAPVTVEGLARGFVEALRAVIGHCVSGCGGVTPSDFPSAELDQEALDHVLARFDPRSVADVYGLSPLQEGLLFHTLLDPTGTDYVVQLVHEVAEGLDVTAFATAWQHVVDRHPALRTTFAWDGLPRPVQIVHHAVEVPLDVLDWTDVPPADVESRLEAHLAAVRVNAFDLTTVPPQRLELIGLADGTHRFVWHSHHIILDGWSVSAVVREIEVAYDGLVAGGSLPAMSAPVPYGAFIRWLADQDVEASHTHWRELLSGFTAATPFPLGAARAAASEVDSAWAVLPAETAERLRRLARTQRLTAGAFLHAAWALLLSRYSGTSDVLFGSTVAGRSADLPGVESVVGLMMNTVPVRLSTLEDLDVVTWVRGVQDQLVRSRDHEHCSLTAIQRCSDVPPGTRLFDTILVFESFAEPGDGDSAGLRMQVVRSHEQTGYPVVMSVSLHDDLQLRLNYQTGRLTRDEAERVVGHYSFLVEQLIERHDGLVGDLAALSAEEHDLLVTEWNRTTRPHPVDETVLTRFADQVRVAPDRVALVAGATSLTYRALDEAAEQVARSLAARRIGRGSLVAIHVRRSAAMVVAVLGVLKAGAGYVPLDPSYPAERVDFVLRDSAAELVVTSSGLPALAADVPELVIGDGGEIGGIGGDRTERVRSSGSDLAYTIYTSGSTGRPKGVEVEHGSLANVVRSFETLLDCGPGDVWLALTSLPFDIAALELFLPLTTGASVIVVPDEAMRDGDAQWAVMREHGVTHVQATPSGWALLLAAGFDAPGVVALMGGEAAPLPLVRDLTGRVRELHNVYGPTEATIWSTTALLEPGVTDVVIGRPVDNTQVYLLDLRLRPVPAGAPGELYLGGRGVARGYAGRAGLTAERFLPDPYGDPGARIYRTGDRARYRADGVIEYLGRADEQVKIRGHRIEPGEIEAHLVEHPDVAQAAVRTYQEADVVRLAAYVVPHGDAPDPAQLREHLSRRLPEVMVPQAYVVLDAMPLTPNGKIDRKALPEVDASHLGSAAEHVEPRTPVEQALAGVWSRVLGVGAVSAKDNFFRLGGDSIRSIHVASLARREGLAVTPGMVLEKPTLAELAAAVADSPAPVSAGTGYRDRFAAVWERIVPLLQRHNVAGVGAALVVDGEITDVRFAGESTLGTGRLIGPGTVFQVGSVSKLVTALGVVWLAAMGRVDLDADVNDYLRGWRMPVLDPSRPVTLRHLLSHTAGLSETSSGGGYAPGEPQPDLADVWFGRSPARTPEVRVEDLPGTRFRYSGANYVAVEQVLADVTGTPFPELMRSVVLEPLGMTRSGFVPPDQSEVDIAVGHSADGAVVEGGWRVHPDLAACGLWSTPADVARVLTELLRAHAGRDGAVLSRAEAGQVLTAAERAGYGLGAVVRSMDSGRWFGHPGDTVGYRAYAAADLADGSGVVVLANGDGGMDLAADLLVELGLGMHIMIERT